MRSQPFFFSSFFVAVRASHKDLALHTRFSRQLAWKSLCVVAVLKKLSALTRLTCDFR